MKQRGFLYCFHFSFLYHFMKGFESFQVGERSLHCFQCRKIKLDGFRFAHSMAYRIAMALEV